VVVASGSVELELDEIADEGVIPLEEEVMLVPTDDEIVEEAEEEVVDDDEAPPPAGGNLASVSFLLQVGSERNDLQFSSQSKVVHIKIDVFRILLYIPTILIGNLESMFRICQSRSRKKHSLELTIPRSES
jgi:hypothetical protein